MDDKSHTPQKNNYVALIIAVALFVVTFALGVGAQSLISGYTNKNDITGWRFIESNDPEALTAEDAVFKQATQSNPVTGSFAKPYMRLQYNIEPHNTAVQLCMTTKYSPLKVVLNAVEIYDNGYLSDDYVGNQYNRVEILPSDKLQTIDVYLYAPFGFQMDAVLESGETGIPFFEMSYLALGFAILIAGIALLIVSFVSTTKSRSVIRMVILSGTIFLCGLSVLFHAAQIYTMYFTGFRWLNAYMGLGMILMGLLFIDVMLYYDKKNMKNIIWSFVVLGLSIVTIFVSSALILQILLGVFAAMLILFVVFISDAYGSKNKNGMQLKTPVRVLLYYVFFLNFYNALSCIFGTYLINEMLITIGMGVTLFWIFTIYMKSYVISSIKSDARFQQINEDSAWIGDISNLLSNIFTQNDQNEFFIEVANGVKMLAERDCGEGGDCSIRTCVAVSRGPQNTYDEIYNQGNVGNCDYNRIEKELTLDGKSIYIGSSYIELLFHSENHPKAIVYIEGLNTRHAANLNNIVHTVYDNVFTAYKNLNLQKDMFSMQEGLFINLAQILEMRFGGTGKHLMTVSLLVERLCIALDFEPAKARLIASAAMTHDIGKIAIPESILFKTGKLTEQEHLDMEKHIWYGRNILSVSNGEFFEIAKAIAYEHHENYDGSGYLSKAGDEINYYARIVRVADVFDALLSKRSYKDAWTYESTSEYIVSGSGTLFDPAVVAAYTACGEDMYQIKITAETETEEA